MGRNLYPDFRRCLNCSRVYAVWLEPGGMHFDPLEQVKWLS